MSIISIGNMQFTQDSEGVDS